MKSCRHVLVIVVLGITAWWPAAELRAAELKVAAVFSDHMVLQRDKEIPVWGWADPGEAVAVDFAGRKTETKAGADGRWLVKLAPLSASDQPRELVVMSASEDRRRVFRDVLVGEVWLGSGQSNMAMTVVRSKDFELEKSAADLPQIRMFTESSGAAKTPQSDGRGEWVVCSPETVGSFSATLFFFGRELHRELKVPVGLINSSVGGTPIESWIAAEAQAAQPELKASHEEAARAFLEFDEARAQAQYEKALARWKEEAAAAKKAGQAAPRRPLSSLEQRNRRGGPGGLFNGKIAPLIPFAIRGAVWYQGEANAQPDRAELYQYQLPLLVGDWRARWGDEFPFAWVQLPNFRRDGEGWMLVREGMLKSLRVPNTGMAITVDIGELDDIHPRNKQDVGRRLAFWALGHVYGRKGIATSGPIPLAVEAGERQLVVSFSHADDGLEARGGTLKGFEVAGKDGQWKAAQATIQGAKVTVSHPEVKEPVAVRYGWRADPDGNLFNGQGLPASPFRMNASRQ